MTSTVAAPVLAGEMHLAQTPVLSVNFGASSSRQRRAATSQNDGPASSAAQPENNIARPAASLNNTNAQDNTLGLSETMDLSHEPGVFLVSYCLNFYENEIHIWF